MRTLPALALASALLLGGCTAAAPEPAPLSPEPAPSETAPGVDEVVESVTIVAGGGEVRVDVHPVLRVGDRALLTLDLEPVAAPDGDLALGDLLSTQIGTGTTAGGAVRLVDLGAGTVSSVARDAAGDAVTTLEGWATVPAGGLTVTSAYAAPPGDAETVGLLLPGAYLPAVPVVDGGPAGAPSPGVDLATVAEAPVANLETYTRELDGAVSTLTSTEQVQVTLGSDVLFTPDSADLSPDAQAAVDVAAAHLAGRAPGTVDVVGHTDDVDDDAHNQDLSRRRAQAVATALTAALGDRAARYPVRTEGRGEAEPLVPNDSDENRALNRRVTLTLTSEVVTETRVEAAGDLPPFDAGPVGPGPQGVEVGSTRPYRVMAPRATRVDGHLVVEVEVTALDQEVDSSFGVAFLNSIWSYRGDGTDTPKDALALTVLSGSTAVYPLDYRAGETAGGRPTWFPLGETDTLRRIDGGQTLRFVAIYPDVAGASTITLQLDERLGAEPLRLTDVPVEG